jgi:hypothetical protein
MAGFREDGDEHSGSIKAGAVLISELLSKALCQVEVGR